VNIDGTDRYLVSKPYAWYMFVLLYLLMLSDWVDRQVIASLFPYLKAEWQLTDTQLGSLVTIVNWTILLIAIPASILMDRWSRKKSVGIMAIIWSIATWACGFAQNFAQLITVRAIIGVGEGGYGPGGSSLIGALFPKRLSATVMGLLWAAGPIGGIIGVLAGGFIAVHYGWRNAFGIVAIPGIVLALLLIFTVKDYKTVDLAISDQSKGTKRKITFKEIILMLTTPTLLMVYLGEAAQMLCGSTLLNWGPSYFNRYYDLPVDQASTRAALIFLMGAIGTMVAGWVLDRWKRKWPKAIMMGTSIFCVFNAVLWIVAFGFLQGQTQYIALLIGAFGASACLGPAYSVSQEAIHPGLRVTSIGMLTIIHQLLGQALGPLLAGVLSDMYDLRTALMIISFVPILAALCFFIGGIYYERDVAKVEKVELAVA
jgi:MFS transporter, Spinster family, sphingosine-1-phosphate transporter